MMRHEFEKYDEYKDSGVEWIQELPTDWNIKRLKEVLVEAAYGISEKTKEFGKYEVLGMGDIYEGKVIFPKKRFIDYVQDNLILKKGDLLYNRTNSIALVGKVGLIEEELENVTFASYLIRLRVKNNQYNKYFWYFLNSQYFIDYSRANAIQTANQANLSSSKLKQFKIIDINLNLQKTIANYLDTKTAQIDQKINLLTKKSAKYSELKQSLISETVTCGLDKTVAMKDSGIEWIGKIPEHWVVMRLKDIARQSKEKNGSNPVGSMLSVSGYRGIEIKQYEDKLKMRTNEELADYRVVHVGQLVVNTMWLNYRGIGVSKYQGYVSPAYRAYYLHNNVYGAYIHYLMRSDLYVAGYSKYLQGIRPNSLQMKTIDFECIPVIIPDTKEQKIIADYLDIKTAQIDRIVETVNTEIEKLKELRKTLINDVVTGKIKVTTEGE